MWVETWVLNQFICYYNFNTTTIGSKPLHIAGCVWSSTQHFPNVKLKTILRFNTFYCLTALKNKSCVNSLHCLRPFDLLKGQHSALEFSTAAHWEIYVFKRMTPNLLWPAPYPRSHVPQLTAEERKHVVLQHELHLVFVDLFLQDKRQKHFKTDRDPSTRGFAWWNFGSRVLK